MIQTSEQTDQIGPALVLAQASMEAAIKGSKNPAYKNPTTGKPMSYASLSDVIDAVKEPLNAQGLYLLHPLVEAKRDHHVACEIRVGHGASGQFISAVFELQVDKQTPQGFGSAGTYVQRYALTSFFSLPQEDDDGNSASKQQPQTKTAQTTPVSAGKAAPVSEAKQTSGQSATSDSKVAEKGITEAQRATLNQHRKDLGLEPFTGAMTFAEYVIAGKALLAEKEKKATEN